MIPNTQIPPMTQHARSVLEWVQNNNGWQMARYLKPKIIKEQVLWHVLRTYAYIGNSRQTRTFRLWMKRRWVLMRRWRPLWGRPWGRRKSPQTAKGTGAIVWPPPRAWLEMREGQRITCYYALRRNLLSVDTTRGQGIIRVVVATIFWHFLTF